MDVREAVLKRRSIRKYTEEQISEEDLLTILEAGLNAPSASNYQPWYFVAVRSPEKMRELLDIMNGVARDHEPLITERFRKHPEVAREVHGFLQTLGGAKTCIIVFHYKEEYLNSGEDIIEHSLGAAIENMLLQAQELGIGSCWVAAPSETGADEIIRQHFAPDKGPFAAIVTLGYAEKVPPAPKRREGRWVMI